MTNNTNTLPDAFPDFDDVSQVDNFLLMHGFDPHDREGRDWIPAYRSVALKLIHDAQRHNETLNDIWNAMHPDQPNDWEYPAQVVRAVRELVKARKEDIDDES